MREIKFRGKKVGNGEWVYGFYSPIIWYPSLEKTPQIKNFNGSDIEVDGNTVGQYTGLKDKNSIEIYEGDIVQCYDDEFSIIKYNNDVAMFEIETQDIVFTFDNVNIKDVRVVGNIYDNPELLGVENDPE